MLEGRDPLVLAILKLLGYSHPVSRLAGGGKIPSLVQLLTGQPQERLQDLAALGYAPGFEAPRAISGENIDKAIHSLATRLMAERIGQPPAIGLGIGREILQGLGQVLMGRPAQAVGKEGFDIEDIRANLKGLQGPRRPLPAEIKRSNGGEVPHFEYGGSLTSPPPGWGQGPQRISGYGATPPQQNWGGGYQVNNPIRGGALGGGNVPSGSFSPGGAYGPGRVPQPAFQYARPFAPAPTLQPIPTGQPTPMPTAPQLPTAQPQAPSLTELAGPMTPPVPGSGLYSGGSSIQRRAAPVTPPLGMPGVYTPSQPMGSGGRVLTLAEIIRKLLQRDSMFLKQRSSPSIVRG